MKIAVSHKPIDCPQCKGVAIWYKDYKTEWGSYSHSDFFCDICRLYIPTIAGYPTMAESLTDGLIIAPDEIVVVE